MTAGVRLDWVVSGAHHLSVDVEVTVVVDVLSFTTTLGVACERGITVLPYRHDYDTAQRFANDNDAVLARRRSEAGTSGISLSPGSIRRCVDPPERLVLPSPNGSTISHLLSESGRIVVAASLRNADAVAAFLVDQHGHSIIAVIAGGERWGDGSLRPAVEDLWGAGAVLDGLVARGRTDLSPEALAAVHAWRGVSAKLPGALHESVSGQELDALGFVDDVRIAAEVGTSAVVPVLDSAVYVTAR